MKKLLFLFISLFFIHKSQAQVGCNYIYSQAGNVVTFNLPPLLTLYTLDSCDWVFGDGNHVFQTAGGFTMTTPHTYSPGTYNACLTIWVTQFGTGTQFTCTSCQIITVGGTTACNASFIFTQNLGTVNFTSTSSGPGTITNHSWTFGDASPPSTQANPIHNYLANGTYIVCHTISGTPTFICTTCDTLVITGVTSCSTTAGFTHVAMGGLAAFTNQTTCAGCGSISYSWNFGDATPLGNLPNPTHTYGAAGNYNVCLIATGIDSAGNTCIDSICKTITISSSSGILENDIHSLDLHPNPTNGEIFFTIPSHTKISSIYIADFTGRKIKEIQPKINQLGEVAADISQIPNGIYLLHVQTENKQVRIAKIIKN